MLRKKITKFADFGLLQKISVHILNPSDKFGQLFQTSVFHIGLCWMAGCIAKEMIRKENEFNCRLFGKTDCFQRLGKNAVTIERHMLVVLLSNNAQQK